LPLWPKNEQTANRFSNAAGDRFCQIHTCETMKTSPLNHAQWAQYERDGYHRLGHVLGDAELVRMQQRLDAIMLGKADLDYNRLMMQLDGDSGRYEDIGAQTTGFKGATLNYRKMERLEFDPLFLEYIQHSIFREICARVYGADTSIRCYRAMFMNKPANKGSLLPWHQDRWTHLDRDPLITIWTALDPATKANGCLQVVPGSHRLGLINPEDPSGFLTAEQAARHCLPDANVYLEMEPGEVMLLHNCLLHSSDKNHSDVSRRAFSVCYMDAATDVLSGKSRRALSQYTLVFGRGALGPADLVTAGNQDMSLPAPT
jgi:phytanoyl-CoA hydroxylase